ncbi:MAG: hypothetical protein L0Y77_04445 [Chlorobi bacterium]|nr:hypothetical protein [Chlorobiota bacterium]
MKTLLALTLCFLSLFAIYGITSTSSNSSDNSITICLDSTCAEDIWTCRLYDSTNTNIGTCIVSPQTILRCCTVKDIPFPRTYYWKISNDSTTCTGNNFFYEGGKLTVNFSCNNCQ